MPALEPNWTNFSTIARGQTAIVNIIVSKAFVDRMDENQQEFPLLPKPGGERKGIPVAVFNNCKLFFII